MLNQDPRPCPACFCNASRRNEETFCTAWNVVTHAYSPQLSFLFCSKRSRNESQGLTSKGRHSTGAPVDLYDWRAPFCQCRKHPVKIKNNFPMIFLAFP